MLILSSVLITLALVFYSTGIWAERFSRLLKPWHVVMFWLGFASFRHPYNQLLFRAILFIQSLY